MLQQSQGFAASYLASTEAGGESWWNQLAAQGSPLVESIPHSEDLLVTFLWRDPQGGPLTSPIKQVYIDINGITDHHSFTPASLKRLNQTDVWFFALTMAADWRGSYSFVPVMAHQQAPQPSGSADEQRQQQRAWWCSLFPFHIADPLNRYRPHMNSRGMPLSAVHLPLAISQVSWLPQDQGISAFSGAGLAQLDWRSQRLGISRRVWLWQPPAAPETLLPLVILLDGKNWAERMPIFAVLETQTSQGALPPAAWLLVDSVNDDIRARELPCNEDFWRALQDELLPQLAPLARITDDPARTVVAGQSYGGLAALYAGVCWPERFGCVLTQSGSFWWPNLKFITHFAQRESHQPGWLTQHVRQCPPTSRLRIFQEAGIHEADIQFVNQQIYQALRKAGCTVNYRAFNGGHDGLCWRGGLVDGVRWLLADV